MTFIYNINNMVPNNLAIVRRFEKVIYMKYNRYEYIVNP